MEYEGRLDCFTCDDKLKEERGHDKEGILPFLINGQRIFRCPLTLITPLSWEYIKAFSFYEKGFLPNGRGWIYESSRFIQSMMILDNAIFKIQQQELKSDGRNRPKHKTSSH